MGNVISNDTTAFSFKLRVKASIYLFFNFVNDKLITQPLAATHQAYNFLQSTYLQTCPKNNGLDAYLITFHPTQW